MIHGDPTKDYLRVAMVNRARVWRRESAQKIADAQDAIEKAKASLDEHGPVEVRCALLEELTKRQDELIDSLMNPK